ncbi:MAG: ABC transporter substrate-binding protein [Acetobacteraceae bacterium]|nr:ABC transporter substrate-binding protein [Acetobacteraceae bacterium]
MRLLALALAATVLAGPASAQIKVGVTVSATGPASSLGVPEKNAVAFLPTSIDGQTIEYIVLDDGTDASRAVANGRKLIDENNIDLLIGSTATPASLALVDVAGEKHVPLIALAASEKIIAPVEGAKRWAFKTPQNDSLMARGIADYMAAHGVKTVGFIGFNDAYGDGWLTEATKAFSGKGISIVATERYARNDQSVTGQVLKLIAARPDAVLIAAAGTPAALPQKTLKERGYTGGYYQTHGVTNQDFLRVGGKDVDGTVLPAGPVLVPDQLADGNPIKPVASKLVAEYNEKYGAGSFSTFAAHMFDAGIELAHAVPAALKAGKPGTAEFRSALRDAIEQEHEVVLSNGVIDMSPTDHNGMDDRARVMVTIQNGAWVLIK